MPNITHRNASNNKDWNVIKTLQHNITAYLTILFITLFSLQACAQQEPEQALNKETASKTQPLQDDTELSAEELALLSDDSNINISFANKSLKVEFADSFEERALGLMYRKTLCEDCGMLFQFDSERIASIWMKNTYIPLDLAYITEQGEIVAIKQLTPHDLTSVPSPKPVLYALEMNQGWFAKQDIRVGDKVEMLP